MSVDHGISVEKVAVRPKSVVRAAERNREHALFLTENPMEARSLSNKTTTSQTTGRDEELYRFDSQEFLDLVKYSSKGDDSAKRAEKYLTGFRKSVHSHGRNLEGDIDRQKSQLSTQDEDFSEHFRMAYSSILYSSSTGQALAVHSNQLSVNSNNILYHKSAEVLRGATSLVKQLQRSYSDLNDQRALLIAYTDWQADFHEMKRILDAGRKVGEQKVESILTNSNKTQPSAPTDEVPHQLFDQCTRLTSNLTWNEAVRKQGKAIMKLVDTLPLE